MKKKLIVIFSIVIIIPIIIIGVFTKNTAINLLDKKLKENTQNMTHQIVDEYDKYFESYNKSLIMLSNKNITKKCENVSKNALIKTLNNYLKGFNNLSKAYIGTEKGKLFIMPNKDLPENFNHKKRLWYKLAKETKKPVWTSPYIDASSNKYVVTGAISIHLKNKFVGVIGLDIYLENLSKDLLNKNIGKDGYPVLLDKERKIIFHPNEMLINKNMPIKKINEAINSSNEGSVYARHVAI
ncbi:MAG: PDC sensor domain-containing protein [Bacillota bacterium]